VGQFSVLSIHLTDFKADTEVECSIFQSAREICNRKSAIENEESFSFNDALPKHGFFLHF
jgi:hypothetical protein